MIIVHCSFSWLNNFFFQGLTEDSPKMNKTVGLKPLFDGHNVQKGYSCLSGKTDDEMLDSVSVRDALEMVDEDKATQVLFLFSLPLRKR